MAPDKFLYRLMGTAAAAILGGDHTGSYLGVDVTPEMAQLRLDQFNQVLATGEPYFSSSMLPQKDLEFITVYRGIFPGRIGERRLIYLPVAPIHHRIP